MIGAKHASRTARAGATAALLLACVAAYGEQHLNKKDSDKEKKSPPLESFYIVTQAMAESETTSDAPAAPANGDAANGAPSNGAAPNRAQLAVALGPAWTDTIVDVAPEGTGARVRQITIEPAVGLHCPPHAVIVREVDRVLDGDTVKQAAGRHKLCAMNESDVAGVIQATAKDDVARANSDDFGTTTIVASCGGKERLFELPYPDTLRFHALGLADSHITALWKMAAEVTSRAFGTDSPGNAAVSAADDLAAQKLAEKIVPEMRAGKYASGFGDSNCEFASCRDHSAASALQGYAGVQDPASCTTVREQPQKAQE